MDRNQEDMSNHRGSDLLSDFSPDVNVFRSRENPADDLHIPLVTDEIQNAIEEKQLGNREMWYERDLTASGCITSCAVIIRPDLQRQHSLGGDVLQETISANVSDDAVMLEFQRSDGTLVTQLVDFRYEVQILKALVLGEEERGQSQYQVMCFVCHIQKDEFISSDAMAKLRQKNPGTIRTPEEDRGLENFTMDVFVDVSHSAVISKHIVDLCSEAADATYTRRADIELWARQPGRALSTLLGTVKEYPESHSPLSSNSIATNSPNRCMETASPWVSCICHLEICIGWYPCSLKYCKGKGADSSSYRCGIKTCKKCYLFSYYVPQKQLCLWDE